ncbi:hypothetical protein EDC01DRAFT_630728 [Geopyxis carbonaria]|nr:hypothetical protein EDC01DRAFT_630728 [Geopyxis carbonaria]
MDVDPVDDTTQAEPTGEQSTTDADTPNIVDLTPRPLRSILKRRRTEAEVETEELYTLCVQDRLDFRPVQVGGRYHKLFEDINTHFGGDKADDNQTTRESSPDPQRGDIIQDPDQEISRKRAQLAVLAARMTTANDTLRSVKDEINVAQDNLAVLGTHTFEFEKNMEALEAACEDLKARKVEAENEVAKIEAPGRMMQPITQLQLGEHWRRQFLATQRQRVKESAIVRKEDAIATAQLARDAELDRREESIAAREIEVARYILQFARENGTYEAVCERIRSDNL